MFGRLSRGIQVVDILGLGLPITALLINYDIPELSFGCLDEFGNYIVLTFCCEF
jgi:hypothetical protein